MATLPGAETVDGWLKAIQDRVEADRKAGRLAETDVPHLQVLTTHADGGAARLPGRAGGAAGG